MNRAGVSLIFSVLLILCCTLELTQCIETKRTTNCPCVWSGSCGLSDKHTPRICVSKQCMPVPVSNRTVKTILATKCPQYSESTAGLPLLCCDAGSADILIQKLSLVDKFFGECPTCVKNINRLLCDVICSPKQSEFLEIKKSSREVGLTDEFVVKIIAYVAQQYLDATYESCRYIYDFRFDLACEVGDASRCTRKLGHEYQPNTSRSILADLGVIFDSNNLDGRTFWNKTAESCTGRYVGLSASENTECSFACTRWKPFPGDDIDEHINGPGYLPLVLLIPVVIVSLSFVFAIATCICICLKGKVRSPGIVHSAPISGGTALSGSTNGSRVY